MKGQYLEEQECPAGGTHKTRPDGGCVVCVKCGFSPC
jgi:hypothetical protein